jgi:hypothetical protein
MTRIITSEMLYDAEPKVIDVVGGESVKMQAVGDGVFTLKGRLSNECEWDTICAIKASSFSKSSSIADTSVWFADVSGYSSITVENEGFTKIYATIIG